MFSKKKITEIDKKIRGNMLEISANLSLRKQAKLLGVTRSMFYYKPVIDSDSEIANLIREAYLSSDCRYGYRKITSVLRNQNIFINNKKILKLMREMGLKGLYPKRFFDKSIKNSDHKIYPYLLKDLKIKRQNQVWATDITYIKLNGSFMYFSAVMDLYSRYIVSYDLSHSLKLDSVLLVLDNALKIAIPEILNTDQGSQFTSNDFTEKLLVNGVKISMDHTGRCYDNIFIERLWRTLKQEVICYYKPENLANLESRINEFVDWYNNRRLHQALKYKTPFSVYFG